MILRTQTDVSFRYIVDLTNETMKILVLQKSLNSAELNTYA